MKSKIIIKNVSFGDTIIEGKGVSDMIVEKDTWFMNGYISSLVISVALLVAFLNIFHQQMVVAVISFLLAIVLITGLTMNQPNEIVVVQFFGMYVGSIRSTGWIMTVPLTRKTKVSQKIHRFTTETIHIQLKDDQLIGVSAVVTYKVVDAAKALFTVDAYLHYVKMEAYLLMNTIAIPFLKQEGTINMKEINEEMKHSLQKNVHFAGIEIIACHCVIDEK